MNRKIIKIKSTDGSHQYDSEGRAITNWHSKKCAWIVNPEFENDEIDWYGKDSDFPAGETLSEFIERNPNWDKLPDIQVTWIWNTKKGMIDGLGCNSISEIDWYEKTSFPYSESRSWGYIDESKETSIERFGKYCDFNKHADKTIVRYNNEVIFEGKLK